MWHRDESKYNTRKFTADVDLLDQNISDGENEDDDGVNPPLPNDDENIDE